MYMTTTGLPASPPPPPASLIHHYVEGLQVLQEQKCYLCPPLVLLAVSRQVLPVLGVQKPLALERISLLLAQLLS